MILGLDAMGSDLGPSAVIEPAKRFVQKRKAELWVYGDADQLSALNGTEHIKVIPTTEVMAMDDGPLAVRRKKDSSMVRAVTDLRDGKIDGVLSAGSTGALLSAGSLLVKPAANVERAGILSLIPSKTGTPFALLDMGANASCTAEQLLNFAYIGKAYMRAVCGTDNPRIGLLNIGSEAHKGDDLRQEAYRLFSSAKNLNFTGNIESNRIFDGLCDVVVTDGFSGNVLEKAMEGTSAFILSSLKKALSESGWKTKLGALLVKDAVNSVRSYLDPDQYGGALIAGLNAPIVKAHGNSRPEAFDKALEQLYKAVSEDIVGKVKADLR